MSEFVVSFEGIEFDHKQSKSVQKAIEAAAHKQVESMASSSNAILKDPPPGQDPTVPGPPYGVSPSKPKPGPSGPSGPTSPTRGVGKPIGRGPLPIVFPVAYVSETQSWTRK